MSLDVNRPIEGNLHNIAVKCFSGEMCVRQSRAIAIEEMRI